MLVAFHVPLERADQAKHRVNPDHLRRGNGPIRRSAPIAAPPYRLRSSWAPPCSAARWLWDFVLFYYLLARNREGPLQLNMHDFENFLWAVFRAESDGQAQGGRVGEMVDWHESTVFRLVFVGSKSWWQ